MSAHPTANPPGRISPACLPGNAGRLGSAAPPPLCGRAPHRPAPWAAALIRLRSARRDTRGAAAVEFALVSGMLLTTILFVMSVGLLLYLGQALDRATSVAARQIMTGAVQKQGMNQTTFITNVLCPALPATFNCNNVIVNVQTLNQAAGPAGYYTFVNSNQTALIVPPLSNGSTQFNLGLQSNYVYMQVIYPITFLPAFLSNIFSGGATYQGAPAYLAMSTAAFRNEQY